MKISVNRKQIVGLNRYLVLLFCAMLASAMFVQAVNIGSITNIYIPLQLQGFSLIFGRYDASTFYCQNGTTGLTTTGVFSTLWNDHVETGQLIRLMPENFTVTGVLNVPTGVTVEGSGRSSIGSSPSGGTILTLEYDGNVFEASGNPSQGVTIRDLTINGQRHQRLSGTAIYGKFRYLLVENVYIMDMDTDGIAIEDTTNTVDCWDVHVVNCYVWWCDEYGVRAGTRATDMTIEGGHIAYCDIAGFYTTVGGHKLSSVTLDCSHYNVYIYGGSARLELCNIDQAHRYNVYIQSISGDGSNAITISGGKISKASVETDNTYAQIYLQGYGTGDTNAARDIIIMGVQFLIGGAGAGQSKHCIEFAGINERDITVFGNDFRWGYITAVFGGTWPVSSVILPQEGWSQPTSEASYIFSKVGTSYYALNTATMVNDYVSTNASYVINSARGALTSGGLLFAGPDTYTLDTNILLNNNIQLRGAGASTKFVANGNFNAIRLFGTPSVNKYNVTVSDLQLIGNDSKTNTLNYGVYFYYVTNCLVERVYTSGFGAPAAIDMGAATGCTVRNCWIQNATVNGLGLGEGSYYNIFEGNHITNTTQFNGIDLNGIADRCDYNQIRDNIIRNSNVSGICLDSANNNTISGNSIYNCRLGIGLGGSLGSSNNVVESNYVEGSWGPTSTGHGIHVQTVSSLNNDVKGNMLVKNVAMGILLTGSFGTVSDNTCRGNGRGIDVYGDNWVIENNLCLNNTVGSYIRSTADRTIWANNAVESITEDGTNTVWEAGNTLNYKPCENSGAVVNATATTFTITHGLAGTPSYEHGNVLCSFNSTAVTGYSWAATSSTITVTISGISLPSKIACYWAAKYEP